MTCLNQSVLTVVLVQQVIGPHIRQVPAGLIDDAEVRDGARFLIQDFKGTGQVLEPAQILTGAGLGDDLKLGTPLLQEQFDDLSVVIDLGFDGTGHPLPGESGVVDVDGPPDQEERHKGADQADPDELAVEPGVIALPLGLPIDFAADSVPFGGLSFNCLWFHDPAYTSKIPLPSGGKSSIIPQVG